MNANLLKGLIQASRDGLPPVEAMVDSAPISVQIPPNDNSPQAPPFDVPVGLEGPFF